MKNWTITEPEMKWGIILGVTCFMTAVIAFFVVYFVAFEPMSCKGMRRCMELSGPQQRHQCWPLIAKCLYDSNKSTLDAWLEIAEEGKAPDNAR